MKPVQKSFFLMLGGILLLAAAAILVQGVLAYPNAAPSAQLSAIHPNFPLLDENGKNVLDTQGALSLMQTCGQCHDTEYIASHSFHSDLGLSDLTAPGSLENARTWDTSPGMFGKWNSLTYRYLSPAGDERLDLTTPDFLRTFAARVVGGGPGVFTRAGGLLTDPASGALPVETTSADGNAWNWQKSGALEVNCLLCHSPNPNNAARIQAIQAGQFRWASAATLLGSGIVERAGSTWGWNVKAFTEDKLLAPEYVQIQDPTNANCAQCHGLAHSGSEPVTLTDCSLQNWETATTGQLISSQKIAESGMNISGKQTLARAWDIHAERGLQCTDCHYSLNNPVYYQEINSAKPEHLLFDPRRLEIGEYLERPNHNFARGQSAQSSIAPELKGTMRRCESCHNAVDTHDWLPYAERHIEELACESCHVPQLYAPAIQTYDWTVLTAEGGAVSTCRGVQGETGTLTDLITGYQPVLLARQNIDGNSQLAPYNLITAFYWVYDDPTGGARPVRLADLQAAWFAPNGAYAPEVLRVFDADGDNALSGEELRIDTKDKQTLIAGRLAGLGLANPRIQGEVQPYSINHNVTRAEWAVSECAACHNDTSRLAEPMLLADFSPVENVTPALDTNVSLSGNLYTQEGALYYQASAAAEKLYVFGHSRISWIDWLGALAFVGVLAGVSVHGGLRFAAALRRPKSHPKLKRVYMYAVYERFWHWLQTFAIMLLLFTGLVIHRPDIFGWFSFKFVVLVHNIVAVILVINAALSLFYHLVSGEIQQYIPRPYGFFDQAIVQAKFYLQGIFKGDEHPFEKTRDRKLNPLQQLTYFGILNVLLPLQILTGALMWGVQRVPQIADWFGGLPLLAPFHSLVAWLFGTFIVAHVYLTTTGHEPLAGIKAMINGWDDVETHEAEADHEVAANPQAPAASPEETTGA